jgi:hypothetical protein
MGMVHGPCEYFLFQLFFIFSFLFAFNIGIPFALKFHLHFCSNFVVTFLFYLLFLSFDLQKFNDKEWLDVATCNLVETMHNL